METRILKVLEEYVVAIDAFPDVTRIIKADERWSLVLDELQLHQSQRVKIESLVHESNELDKLLDEAVKSLIDTTRSITVQKTEEVKYEVLLQYAHRVALGSKGYPDEEMIRRGRLAMQSGVHQEPEVETEKAVDVTKSVGPVVVDVDLDLFEPDED